MASTLLQVRIDDSVKKETQEIFQNLGLTMSGAIKLFLNRVIVEQGLPFKMNLERPVTSNSEDGGWNLIEYLEGQDLTKDMIEEYLEEKDSKTAIAFLLYPYINNDELSFKKAAELLNVSRLDLIGIYSSLGIAYVDQNEKETIDDLRTLEKIETKR